MQPSGLLCKVEVARLACALIVIASFVPIRYLRSGMRWIHPEVPVTQTSNGLPPT